ncbi:MAG: putative oxidoreductase C-terminal domain-containing protein, partial [Bacteroidota bacterium]
TEQNYKPVLYVEPVNAEDETVLEASLSKAIEKIGMKFSGLSFKKADKGWEIIIPDEFKVGHEAHFAQVTEKYLQYLIDGKLPEWEVPNMLAKYYVTTKAYEMSQDH